MYMYNLIGNLQFFELARRGKTLYVPLPPLYVDIILLLFVSRDIFFYDKTCAGVLFFSPTRYFLFIALKRVEYASFITMHAQRDSEEINFSKL